MRAQQGMQAVLREAQPLAIWEGAAAVVVAVSTVTIYLASAANPRIGHMAAHVFIMNALAPFIAVALSRAGLRPPMRRGAFALATAAQIALLYLSHAPKFAVHHMQSPAGAFLQLALLLAAVAFWCAILNANPWRAAAALAIAGKLYCLLGVLLLFSPHVIGGAQGAAALDDQRAAGLLMLAICPLSYLAAAVALAAREILRS
jgi:putative membrane protein